MYRLKRIDFNGKRVSILLQNENGPCPLLAMCNVLLLQGHLSYHEDIAVVLQDELLAAITAQLVGREGPSAPEAQAQWAHAVQEALQVLPKTAVGLDVNVKFTAPSAFEATADTLLFDLLGLKLLHGWLADTQAANYPVLSRYSYNAAAEAIVAYQTSQKTTPAPPSSPNQAEPDGAVLERWCLHEAATQLTYPGLIALHEVLKDEELAVFYRNGHFSTLLRRGAHLYVLITDEGFLKVHDAVWEVLDEISGDTQFTDASFRVRTPRETSASSSTTVPQLGAQPTVPQGAVEEDEEALLDATNPSLTEEERQMRASQRLALQLQAEEDRLAQAEADRLLALKLQDEENAREDEDEDSSDSLSAPSPSPSPPVRPLGATSRTVPVRPQQPMPAPQPVSDLKGTPAPSLSQPPKSKSPRQGKDKKKKKDKDDECIVS